MRPDSISVSTGQGSSGGNFSEGQKRPVMDGNAYEERLYGTGGTGVMNLSGNVITNSNSKGVQIKQFESSQINKRNEAKQTSYKNPTGSSDIGTRLNILA